MMLAGGHGHCASVSVQTFPKVHFCGLYAGMNLSNSRKKLVTKLLARGHKHVKNSLVTIRKVRL